jgi:hypothetical protein
VYLFAFVVSIPTRQRVVTEKAPQQCALSGRTGKVPWQRQSRYAPFGAHLKVTYSNKQRIAITNQHSSIHIANNGIKPDHITGIKEGKKDTFLDAAVELHMEEMRAVNIAQCNSLALTVESGSEGEAGTVSGPTTV